MNQFIQLDEKFLLFFENFFLFLIFFSIFFLRCTISFVYFLCSCCYTHTHTHKYFKNFLNNFFSMPQKNKYTNHVSSPNDYVNKYIWYYCRRLRTSIASESEREIPWKVRHRMARVENVRRILVCHSGSCRSHTYSHTIFFSYSAYIFPFIVVYEHLYKKKFFYSFQFFFHRSIFEIYQHFYGLLAVDWRRMQLSSHYCHFVMHFRSEIGA